MSSEAAAFLLPTNVVPRHYDVYFATNLKSDFKYEGEVRAGKEACNPDRLWDMGGRCGSHAARGDHPMALSDNVCALLIPGHDRGRGEGRDVARHAARE